MKPDWPEVESLLDEVLELTPEERAPFLERVGARAPELRAEVERWLRATERGNGFLDQSGAEYVAPLVSATEETGSSEGTRIGPYRITGVAGHGGMGMVYVAERDEPYHQRVALKLVRGAVALGDHVVRRLIEERSILASLEHPHIARLVDGGVTDEGLPWFAMEYVEGEPIDQYCDKHNLQLQARLQLFLTVCDAVEFAHRNLVVHRDLKPSNILVTGTGEVKLLDFGIAKLLAEGRSDVPLTETGLRLLTPEYASPEQIRGEPIAITSDVYSLGVLLYELLTGRRPYRLSGRNSLDIERAILQPPQRPSAIVVDLRLGRRLRGDLDTIVLTALHAEPARRYPSVEQLATDLRRYLTGLPVTARPDRLAYRAGKFVRRHRLGVTAAGVIFLFFVGGFAATLWQAREAAREAARSERVIEFLVSLFQEAGPEQARGREVTARELLNRGERRLDSLLVQEPDLRARLLGVLGVIHTELGLYGGADSLLARAVALTRQSRGDQSPELAAQLADWAEALSELAKFEAADSAARKALAIRRRSFGPEDSTVAATLRLLGGIARRLGRNDSAKAFYREALTIDRQRYGDGHLVVAQDLNDLGVVLQQSGNLPAAESAAVAALNIRRKLLDSAHPSVLVALHNLGVVRQRQGDYKEAERLTREVIEQRRRLYPQGHPDVALALQELGSVFDRAGRHAEAESLFVQALTMQRALLGPAHPETIVTVNNLAILRYWKGDLRAAERDMREVLNNWRRTLGEEHQNTLTALTTLSAILREQGNYREGEPLLRRALASRQKLFGDSHADVAQSWSHLGGLLYSRGDAAGAEHAFRQALAIDRKVLPAGHDVIAWRLTGLGEALIALGRAAEAESMLREALAIRVEKLKPADRLTAKTRRVLGVCLARLRHFEEAEALLLQSYRELSANPNWLAQRDATESAQQLAEFYT